MEELEISGKRYISTRRAAREHGYHSDYMGQLIRGGKVAGQKVGRAWYIDEQSLAAYFNKEQSTQPVVKKETPAPEVAAPAPAPVIEPAQAIAPVPDVIAEAPIEAVATKEEPAPIVSVLEMPEAHAEKIIIKKIAEPEEIFVEEKSARTPLAAPFAQEVGGLRYAADDSPSLPIVTRMPHVQTYSPAPAPAPAMQHAAHAAPGSRFPIISLSAVGLVAIAAALFASNFVSTTIVSEPGKSAVVHYAIHW